MSFDNLKNFAYSSVANAPGASGTSLIVFAGDGAKFPAAPFNLTVWPVGVIPTLANAEIVRVTAVSTDTFTITRAQESTTARTIIVGDQVALTVTAKTLTDLQGKVGGAIAFGDVGVTTPNNAISLAGPALAILQDGSIWVKFDTTADALNWNKLS